MATSPLRLLQVFLVLSVGLLTATAVLSVVDPAVVNTVVWIRAAGVLVLALMSLRWVAQFARGSRSAYRRLVWISVAGSVGIAALALLPDSPYPAWVRAEQAVQGLVLVALAFTLLRPKVRRTLRATR
jgi:hypothetical protein